MLARWKSGQPGEEVDTDGVRIVRVGVDRPRSWTMPISANPLWRSAIRREVERSKPDVIMAREIMLAEASADVARRRDLPVLIDMAEHYPATMRSFKKYRDNALARLLVFHARVPDHVERRSVERADGILTVCDEQNHRLNQAFGYREDRMAVVHNTPALDAFPGVRLGSSTPPRVFAYHGAMTPQRGLDLLLRGFALANANHPDIRLDLCGTGESFHDLVAQARDLGIADRVRFTGSYHYADLARLYSETDVGLVTYPTDESIEHTIGNKLFDYLLCGKPVIVSPVRPLRRVVEETESGLVLNGCSPASIAWGIESFRVSDPAPFAGRGLAAARSKYHWERDSEVLCRFVDGYA